MKTIKEILTWFDGFNHTNPEVTGCNVTMTYLEIKILVEEIRRLYGLNFDGSPCDGKDCEQVCCKGKKSDVFPVPCPVCQDGDFTCGKCIERERLDKAKTRKLYIPANERGEAERFNMTGFEYCVVKYLQDIAANTAKNTPSS